MLKLLYRISVGLLILVIAGFGLHHYRFQQGVKRAAQIVASFPVEPVGDIGATKTLRILPLIEYASTNPALATEVGLSYLVDTDEHRILYDVGQNTGGESPSPLQRNMQVLGVELATIDTVFISHNHLDHVGGMHWQRKNSFSLGTEQTPFPNPATQLVAPDLMSYPGMSVVYANRPMQIGNGVGSTGLGTTGTIPRQLALGWIEEHSLVVIVEGLGGVLIVGCGHQSIPNLIKRYHQAYSEPLYGLVGGLHFPVPKGRIILGPLDAQRRLASGDGLFSPLTMEEVDRQIAMLQQLNLGLIAVSAHDSSDEVIEKVRNAFGDAHRYLRMGDEITITAKGGGRSE